MLKHEKLKCHIKCYLCLFIMSSTFGSLFISIPGGNNFHFAVTSLIVERFWSLFTRKHRKKRHARVLTVLRTKNPLHSYEYVTAPPSRTPSLILINCFVFVCVYSPLLVFITLSVFDGGVFAQWLDCSRTYAWDTEFSESSNYEKRWNSFTL